MPETPTPDPQDRAKEHLKKGSDFLKAITAREWMLIVAAFAIGAIFF